MSDGGTGREPLGLAFLGCGDATRMHSKTLRGLDPAVARFYASRDRSRAAAFAKETGGRGAFGSYEEALADPGVDAVLIATPPAFHLEWTLAALEAGKDVIVEKPAFPHSADADRAAAAAEEHGRRVLVAENYHYKPLAEALRKVLDRGDLGRPLLLRFNALKRQEGSGWRADPELAGGGALLEGGIHWVSLMAGLGLEVRSVAGFRPGRGGPGDRSSLVVFEYEGGAVGTLAYSWDVPSLPGGPRMSAIFGTEGRATFESNGLFLATSGRRWRLSVPGLRDLRGFRAMFTDFLEALRTGGESSFTLAMARRDLELVERAEASMQAGE